MYENYKSKGFNQLSAAEKAMVALDAKNDLEKLYNKHGRNKDYLRLLSQLLQEQVAQEAPAQFIEGE